MQIGPITTGLVPLNRELSTTPARPDFNSPADEQRKQQQESPSQNQTIPVALEQASSRRPDPVRQVERVDVKSVNQTAELSAKSKQAIDTFLSVDRGAPNEDGELVGIDIFV